MNYLQSFNQRARKLTQAVTIGAMLISTQLVRADTLFSENFDGPLNAKGWIETNLSAPVGPVGWRLGWDPGSIDPLYGYKIDSTTNPGGATYVTVGYRSADLAGGVLDNWLLSPIIRFGSTDTVTFFTAAATHSGSFANRLELRLSTSGASTSPSSFDRLLLTVNPSLAPNGYLESWVGYGTTFSVADGAMGRIAFRYALPDNVNFGTLIGVDLVTIEAPVPEPQTGALLLFGLAAMGVRRWRADRAEDFAA